MSRHCVWVMSTRSFPSISPLQDIKTPWSIWVQSRTKRWDWLPSSPAFPKSQDPPLHNPVYSSVDSPWALTWGLSLLMQHFQMALAHPTASILPANTHTPSPSPQHSISSFLMMPYSKCGLEQIPEPCHSTSHASTSSSSLKKKVKECQYCFQCQK